MTESVHIDKLVYGGSGLARVNGQVLFVPFTAPGDQVLVSIIGDCKDYRTGEVAELETPGEGRRQAPCTHFRDCGGCQLQHLDYQRQVEQKTAILQETLARALRGVTLPQAEFVTGPEFGYRRNVRFQVEDPRLPKAGFYRLGSRQVVDVQRCPLLEEPLNEAYARLRSSGLLADFTPEELAGIRAIHSRTQRMTVFAVLARGSVRGEEPRVLAYYVDDGAQIISLLPGSEERVEESIGGRKFLIHPLSFFQSNVFLTDRLVQLVGETADDPGGKGKAIELFAGNGLFTMELAQRFGRVVAVEQDQRAVKDGADNTLLNGVGNVKWVHAPVDRWVEKQMGETRSPDFLLVDPPREGLSKAVSRWVLAVKPRRITYVSCSPPTLARDLKRWVTEGDYRIERIVGLDLFPQTFHIETVVSLVSEPS